MGKEPLTRTIVEVYVNEDGDVTLVAPQAQASLGHLLDGMCFQATVKKDAADGSDTMLFLVPCEGDILYEGEEADEDDTAPAREPWAQIDRLAKCILERCPDRITEGGTVDVAISIIEDVLPKKA